MLLRSYSEMSIRPAVAGSQTRDVYGNRLPHDYTARGNGAVQKAIASRPALPKGNPVTSFPQIRLHPEPSCPRNRVSADPSCSKTTARNRQARVAKQSGYI